MSESKSKMYGVIINLKIKDSEYTIIHAISEPVLTTDLLATIIAEFMIINRLRFTFREYKSAIVTVYNGETETIFGLADKHVPPIILREI